MSDTPFIEALKQLAEERGLPVKIVVQTVEAALAAAYRKDYGEPGQVIRAQLNEEDITKTAMFQVYEVVANDTEIEEPERQISVSEAQKQDASLEEGAELVIQLPHHKEFGRIAAQTAKQVIIQRISEAERNMLYDEFKDKEGEVVSGTVQQIEGRDVIVNIGRMNAVMLPPDQVHTERYYIGQRLKVYVRGVEETNRGPKVIVSRAHPGLIRGLFTAEVPEIQAGTVTIEAIAREPGSRTKIAVAAHQDGLDPVGSCVGQRGIRVQAVLTELGDEKIDIILWDEDPKQLIMNALSPAEVDDIELDEKTNTAKIYVPQDQVSLAIGRSGQNVRLASKLTGWNLDIVKESEAGSSDDEATNTDDKTEPEVTETDDTDELQKTPPTDESAPTSETSAEEVNEDSTGE